MARFFLKEIDQKNKKNEDFTKILESMQSIKDIGFTCNIEISILGIRNLLLNAKRPSIILRLTNDPEKRVLTIKLDDSVDTRNPNFGKVVKFEKVKLPIEPLLWPLLEIEVYDDGYAFGVGGCESSYTTISLFEFSDFLTLKDIDFAKAQLNKNQNKLSLVQK